MAAFGRLQSFAWLNFAPNERLLSTRKQLLKWGKLLLAE